MVARLDRRRPAGWSSIRKALTGGLAGLLAGAILAVTPAAAEPRIAVLDFDLNDLSSNPGVPAELARTASLKGMLEQGLAARHTGRIVSIPPAAQIAATPATGYLWDRPEQAAALGRQHGADYVLVGRVTKPSFLFVYFETRLVDTAADRAVGEFYTEVKGQQDKITPKGVERLAGMVDDAVRVFQTKAAESSR